jgi:uncharacterized protein (UPF0147 family)
MKKKKVDVGKELEEVKMLMDEVCSDTSVPRNIRTAVEEAANKLKEAGDVDVNASYAIYLLNDVTNDINMPAHTRTEIWAIISALESIREKNK